MSSNAHEKKELMARLARERGVAVVLLDEDSREISASNDNSICQALMGSPDFAPRCADFCGKAFQLTHMTGEAVDYECHAGLMCRAVPSDEVDRRSVAIVGRTFVRAENYRKVTEKAISGEWSVFEPADFFENVLLTGSTETLAEVSESLYCYSGIPEADLLDLENTKLPQVQIADRTETSIRNGAEETDLAAFEADTPINNDRDEAAAIRSLLASLIGADYEDACELVIGFIGKRNSIESAVWMERRNSGFESILGIGTFAGRSVHVNLDPESDRVVDAADSGTFVELKERSGTDDRSERRKLLLFPTRIGSEVRFSAAIEVAASDVRSYASVGRLVKIVGPQLEILRLRKEVSQSGRVTAGVRKLNDVLKRIDNDDFCVQVTRAAAELLRSERASLLVRDENTGGLAMKAAIGSAVDLARTENLGSRVARRALDLGESMVVSNIESVGVEPAPIDWKYRTNSFISYPITIGDKRLAVMNFTDRADGMAFSESDLELLNAIAPQIAVAIDRSKLKVRAGELEKRSITDSLTGVMNRGYIEERLIEEMNRASRYRFPMSLLMIDVDHFKSYNDNYGHPAGDIALRLVAGVLKRTLRAADVAARYGGEEFAVLLPQTPVEQATWIAERIRQRVERTEFPKRQVTISVGVAGFSSEFEDPKDWITAADMALYEAKDNGRNRIIRYEDVGRSFREKIN